MTVIQGHRFYSAFKLSAVIFFVKSQFEAGNYRRGSRQICVIRDKEKATENCVQFTDTQTSLMTLPIMQSSFPCT